MRKLPLPLRLSEAVVVTVALTLGYALISQVPMRPHEPSPVLRSVGHSEVAHLSYADLHVLDVRTARYLSPLGTSLVTAAGVFVIVTTQLAATKAPTPLATAQLIDGRGRVYVPSDRSSCPQTPIMQTGVPTYVMFCFDVPPDVLPQLHLQLARGGDLFKTTRADELADFDLGLSAGQAETQDAYQVAEQAYRPFTPAAVSVSGPGS